MALVATIGKPTAQVSFSRVDASACSSASSGRPNGFAMQPARVVEFKTEEVENPNADISFDMEICQRCYCPHCEATVSSQYGTEATWLGPALGALLWLVLGWFCVVPLAVAWGQCKDVVHRCPKCRNTLGRQSKIGLPSLRSEVMTFKVGSCAVLLARKYFVMFVLLMCAVLGVHAFRISSRARAQRLLVLDDSPGGDPVATSWAEYLKECRLEGTLRSEGWKASQRRCQGQVFRWRGRLAEIRDGLPVPASSSPAGGRGSLLVRMQPGGSRRPQPSVELVFGEEKNSEVKDLAPGAWVEFEAKLLEQSRRGSPDLMLLRHVAAAVPLRGEGADDEAGSLQQPAAPAAGEEEEEGAGTPADGPKPADRVLLGQGLLGVLSGSDVRLQLQLTVVACLAMLLAWIGCMYARETWCQD